MILDHVEWIVFSSVLANQGGVPLPVAPVLLAADALAGSGRLRLVEILAVAVAATLCADLGWYAVGRLRGTRALALLGRLSPKARAFVSRAQDGFLADTWTFQLGARFLPEMNPIAAGLAGATRLSLSRFVGFGILSAFIWTGTWTGIGYVLGDAALDLVVRFRVHLAAVLLAVLLFHLHSRRRRRGIGPSPASLGGP